MLKSVQLHYTLIKSRCIPIETRALGECNISSVLSMSSKVVIDNEDKILTAIRSLLFDWAIGAFINNIKSTFCEFFHIR